MIYWIMDKPLLMVKNHLPFTISPLKGKHAEKTLSKGMSCLSDYTAWLSAGTLLGFYRDCRLIPHDTDIDIGL